MTAVVVILVAAAVSADPQRQTATFIETPNNKEQHNGTVPE